MHRVIIVQNWSILHIFLIEKHQIFFGEDPQTLNPQVSLPQPQENAECNQNLEDRRRLHRRGKVTN